MPCPTRSQGVLTVDPRLTSHPPCQPQPETAPDIEEWSVQIRRTRIYRLPIHSRGAAATSQRRIRRLGSWS